ncbi:hypothetical protein L9F63_013445, partial [Diploptera punctata]
KDAARIRASRSSGISTAPRCRSVDPTIYENRCRKSVIKETTVNHLASYRGISIEFRISL